MGTTEAAELSFPLRVLSGIQPTGELTLGNYFGAVSNWVSLQSVDDECFYCVVDYHALTSGHDRGLLARRSLEMARDVIACGVDPERSALFLQSQVPEHLELAWILASVASYGALTRMTHFKEKAARQELVSAGLFTYPVLQAADILAYKATSVPVGDDQAQHLELTREIARRFNARYGVTFPETATRLTEAARIMSPTDPTQKMSKSLGPRHYIGVFEAEDSIRKKIRAHVTDTGLATREPGQLPPGVANLLMLLAATAPPETASAFAEAEQAGRLLYSDLKQAVAERLMEHLEPIRRRRAGLTMKQVREILHRGAERAQSVARATLDEARERIGLARA